MSQIGQRSAKLAKFGAGARYLVSDTVVQVCEGELPRVQRAGFRRISPLAGPLNQSSPFISWAL